jgi:hypothetical protein
MASGLIFERYMEQEFFEVSSMLVSRNVMARPDGRVYTSRLIDGTHPTDSTPIVFRQTDGERFCDLVDTGHVSLYLISSRVKAALNDNLCTGWQTFPVKLFDRHNSEIPGYSGLSILGKAGRIDVSDSSIIKRRLAENAPESVYYRGLMLSADSWDGSDLFLPENSLMILASKKCERVIRDGAFSNVRLTSINKIEVPELTAKRIKGLQ